MRNAIILALVVAAAALAGCANNDNETPTPTTAATPTPTASPTPTSVVPTVTPSVPTVTPTVPSVPTLPVTNGTNLTPNLAGVVVVAAADRAESGGAAQVCFRVSGTGTIPHVAVHWDTTSHPNATAFAEYKGGAVYPENASAASPVTLPGTFCSYLKNANQTLYYRAHALAPGDAAHPGGLLSVEKTLLIGAATAVDFVGDMPEVASAGTNATLCWSAFGASGVAPHTAIHWDNVSHPNSTSFADYKGGAIYPNNAPAASNETLPGSFCANLTMPASGTLYYRAHLLQGGNSTLSAERSITVAPAIGVVRVPATAAASQPVNVCWRVEGNGTIPHTALHFDNASHANSTSFADYKGGAAYPNNATAAATVSLPGVFCSNLQMPASGTLYFRAHALNPGLRNELSDEYAIRVQ